MAVTRPLLFLCLAVAIALAANHNRHHHRNRRSDTDLHDWLTAEQKESLKGLEQGTPEFKEKVGVYYNQLPAEKRAEWDGFYKKHCFEWTAKAQDEDQEIQFQEFLSNNNLEKVKERVGELKEKLDASAKKNVELWENDCYKLIKSSRKRREIEPAFQDFVKWMTPEQLGDITALKAAGKDSEVQAKVKEFFGQLPADQQATLKEEFKGKCKVYFTPLMTEEELEKIKTLKGDKAAASALIGSVVERQTGDVKTIATKMMGLCAEVYKDSSRKRREIEAAFQDFVKWMTPEQLGDITALKAAGKESEMHEKVKEFFGQLPAEQQTSLKEEFKGKCKVYFTPLMTEEELEKIKTLKGDKAAAGALVKDVVDRQVGDVKTIATKMMGLCTEVYKESSRKRREIEAAFQDFVKWMTPEQLGDITALKTAGKDSEVQEKVKEFFGQLPADQQATLKEEFKGKCKVYFTPLMTEEELEKIKTLKGDHAAAGALIKGVVDRQVGDVKNVAEKMLGVCGEVYKQSSRMRRELEGPFQDFVKWMTPEQLGDIAAMKAAGKESEVQGKVIEYFDQLPAERQAVLKEEFKGKCRTYFTPLMTDDEQEKIQTVKGDKNAASALVKAVVDRQVGEVKAVAEKMFGICGEVYKASSRKRREIEPAFQDFVKWMTPEQLGDITALKAAGKDSEVQAKVKEFFGQLPAVQQASLKEEFKGKCKVFFTPLMTEEELEKIKTLKADKEAAGALMKDVVGRQVGEVKSTAEKMLGVCGEVYKESSRKRREIEAAFQDFVKWMTPEQVGEIVALKDAGKDTEVPAKVKGFFAELPADKQAELKEEFKGKCKVFFTPLMTEEELEKIKTLKGDHAAAGALVGAVVERQIGEVKSIASKMMTVCGEVYQQTRKRREIEAAFQDFVKWMTPEQLGDITALKAAGKDSEVQGKVKEFFEQLPADQQASLTEEFKGKCKAYFNPLMTEEEQEKIKSNVASGDKEAAKTIVQGVVDRQVGEVKTIAEKMFGVCGEVFKRSQKGKKRDVASKIEKHLSWLQPAEKEEILQMTKDGKSKEDIKKRLLEFVEAKENDEVEKEKTVKLCYAWMDEVATKEEIESLHKLHHVDHGACKKKVREFISKLSEEKQKAVEASLPFCEKLWYGGHDEHSGHEHSHHHHRRRRHLAVIEKFLDWLEPAQKSEIDTLEASGAEFTEIADKIKEFFKLLPEQKQSDLKSKFQNQCMIWAKEVSKPLEWEEIKKLHAAKDHHGLKMKLVELEERLTENQKHTIEHVRGVCYKLWGISDVARLRRVPSSDDFKERAAKYLNWLSEEQLAELQRLKADGKKSEVMKAILKFFDATEGDQKVTAEGKLKEACREYSVKAFGAEKVAEFKKLSDAKADKAEMEKLADGYIAEIEDEEKKEFAKAVVTGCKHVYGSSRSRRELIAREVAEYLQN